jgi:uncharacterized protein (TIGR00730 family)
MDNKYVVIFGTGNYGNDPIYIEKVRQLGNLLADNNHQMMYGGASTGLVKEIADCFLNKNQNVVGVLCPEYMHQGYDKVKLHLTLNITDRKQKMITNAHSFIILPGGIGTLEEFSQVLTMKLTFPKEKRPIIIYNIKNFYDKLWDQLNHFKESGMSKRNFSDYVLMTDDPEQIVNEINKSIQ